MKILKVKPAPLILSFVFTATIALCCGEQAAAAQDDYLTNRDVPEEVILWALIIYQGDDVDRFIDWFLGYQPLEPPQTRSNKAREIVVVGSKVKDVQSSSRIPIHTPEWTHDRAGDPDR